MVENKQENFTRADYLTVAQVARKFGESRELVEKLMKELYLKKATFRMGSYKRPLVIDAKYSHAPNALHLHPLGTDIFLEMLTKKKATQK